MPIALWGRSTFAGLAAHDKAMWLVPRPSTKCAFSSSCLLSLTLHQGSAPRRTTAPEEIRLTLFRSLLAVPRAGRGGGGGGRRRARGGGGDDEAGRETTTAARLAAALARPGFGARFDGVELSLSQLEELPPELLLDGGTHGVVAGGRGEGHHAPNTRSGRPTTAAPRPRTPLRFVCRLEPADAADAGRQLDRLAALLARANDGAADETTASTTTTQDRPRGGAARARCCPELVVIAPQLVGRAGGAAPRDDDDDDDDDERALEYLIDLLPVAARFLEVGCIHCLAMAKDFEEGSASTKGEALCVGSEGGAGSDAQGGGAHGLPPGPIPSHRRGARRASALNNHENQSRGETGQPAAAAALPPRGARRSFTTNTANQTPLFLMCHPGASFSKFQPLCCCCAASCAALSIETTKSARELLARPTSPICPGRASLLSRGAARSRRTRRGAPGSAARARGTPRRSRPYRDGAAARARASACAGRAA